MDTLPNIVEKINVPKNIINDIKDSFDKETILLFEINIVNL